MRSTPLRNTQRPSAASQSRPQGVELARHAVGPHVLEDRTLHLAVLDGQALGRDEALRAHHESHPLEHVPLPLRVDALLPELAGAVDSSAGRMVSCAAKHRTVTASAQPSKGFQKVCGSKPQACPASHSPLWMKPVMATKVASSVAIGMVRTPQ